MIWSARLSSSGPWHIRPKTRPGVADHVHGVIAAFWAWVRRCAESGEEHAQVPVVDEVMLVGRNRDGQPKIGQNWTTSRHDRPYRCAQRVVRPLRVCERSWVTARLPVILGILETVWSGCAGSRT